MHEARHKTDLQFSLCPHLALWSARCVLHTAGKVQEGQPLQQATRHAAPADVLDLAAPCLQGFLGNFIVEVGELLLKQD